MSRRGKVPKGESKLREDLPLETNFMDKFESIEFESIEDVRSSKNQLHSVTEIILVTFLAVIRGSERIMLLASWLLSGISH
jgi:hypothetical protein